jgi:hypothetical protein
VNTVSNGWDIYNEKIVLQVSARFSKWTSLHVVSYRFQSLSTHQRQEQEALASQDSPVPFQNKPIVSQQH